MGRGGEGGGASPYESWGQKLSILVSWRVGPRGRPAPSGCDLDCRRLYQPPLAEAGFCVVGAVFGVS